MVTPTQRWSSSTLTDKVRLLNALISLKRNKLILIKSADKNLLGLVVLDSHTHRDMCLSHLIDTSAYIAVVPDYDVNDSYKCLRDILHRHNKLY